MSLCWVAGSFGELFRRDIGRCARVHEVRVRRILHDCDAEVGDLDVERLCQQDIRRLDVAVNHTLAVGILECVG